MSALFHLTLRQILGGTRVWFLALFLCLPAVLILLILGLGERIPEADVVLTILIYVLYPQSLVILATLLYGSGLLSAEIEARTLVYLLSRPLPRWTLLAVKYAATVCVLAALCLASLTISVALAGFPGGLRTWFALATSVALACVAYTAVFAFIGLLAPRRAVPVGLIYAGVLEIALSFVPAFVNQLSVSHYLRSLAYRMWSPEHLPAEATRALEQALVFVGDTGPWASVLALLVFPVVALALSAALLELREWPLTDDL